MKLPAIQLYPGDWMRDGVAGCSLAAQGLWFRMLLVMHDCAPYGHLVENGAAMRPEAIARRCGCSPAEFRRYFAELEAAGIPSVAGGAEYVALATADAKMKNGTVLWSEFVGVEAAGVIYSRRMVRDMAKKKAAQITGKEGGSPLLPLNPTLNPTLKGALNQTPRVRDRARPEAEAEEVKPSSQSGEKPPEKVASTQLDADSLQRVVAKLDVCDFKVHPPEQIALAWLIEYGEELIIETLADAESRYSGKHFTYLEKILTGRRDNPNERPGNRRRAGARTSERGNGRPRPITLAGNEE